eukprot:2504245-Rhodomonas_salina.3
MVSPARAAASNVPCSAPLDSTTNATPVAPSDWHRSSIRHVSTADWRSSIPLVSTADWKLPAPCQGRAWGSRDRHREIQQKTTRISERLVPGTCVPHHLIWCFASFALEAAVPGPRACGSRRRNS